MVFVGRILDGITAGNLSTAQAYISDHTKPEDRAKSFGIIGIAFGLGFMCGPGIGGWLGEIDPSYPFLLAASLSLTSMICTYALLSDEKPPQADASPAAAAAAPVGPGGKRPSPASARCSCSSSCSRSRSPASRAAWRCSRSAASTGARATPACCSRTAASSGSCGKAA
jgi:MFS family permease